MSDNKDFINVDDNDGFGAISPSDEVELLNVSRPASSRQPAPQNRQRPVRPVGKPKSPAIKNQGRPTATGGNAGSGTNTPSVKPSSPGRPVQRTQGGSSSSGGRVVRRAGDRSTASGSVGNGRSGMVTGNIQRVQRRAARTVENRTEETPIVAAAPSRSAQAASSNKGKKSEEKRYSYPENFESGEDTSGKRDKYSSKKRNKSDDVSEKEAKKSKMTVGKVIRRILVALLAIILVLLVALYSLGLMLAYGPSVTARDKAVMSALQASATKWVPGLFLSQDTINKIVADSEVVVTDTKTIDEVEAEDAAAPDLFANAIDGMVLETVNGASYKGYVLLIKDPSRVIAGTSQDSTAAYQSATLGMRIWDCCSKYNATAVINGGEFTDIGGVGAGEKPVGLTYTRGNCIWNDGYTSRTFIGIDKDNKMVVADSMTKEQADALGVRDGVSFQTGNTLISNDGTNVTYYYADSNTGVSQRTAVGQRWDGTIIMVVTDGRTASSMGATRNDIINLLVDYGAVAAGMLDGGSSTMLYYPGYYEKYNINKSELDEYQLDGMVNKYKAFTTPRYLPTFFVVLPE